MTKKLPLLIPALLFILSFFLRLNLISKGPYHTDCLGLSIASVNTLEDHQLHYLFGPGYPLTVILGALFIMIARLADIHDPVLAVNMMSVVFSSLGIVIFYFLAEKIWGRRTAFYSASVLSVCPIYLALSVYGKSHIPSLFFLILGIYFLMEYVTENSKRSMFLSALSLGLMGACRIQDLILMMPAVSFLFVKRMEFKGQTVNADQIKVKLKRFSVFLLIILISVGVFYIPLLAQQTNAEFNEQMSRFTHIGLTANFRGFFSDSLQESLFYIIENLSIIGFYLTIIGIYYVTRSNPSLLGFLFLWAVVPLSFYGNLWSTVPRFMMISLLPPSPEYQKTSINGACSSIGDPKKQTAKTRPGKRLI